MRQPAQPQPQPERVQFELITRPPQPEPEPESIYPIPPFFKPNKPFQVVKK